MIQYILVVIALLVAIYILANEFILKQRRSSSTTKACGKNSGQCGCE